MKSIYLVIFLIFSQINYSQELLMDFEVVTPADEIYPKFNGGGVEKFYEFIKENFDLSKINQAGLLKVSFKVNTDGDLKNIKVTKFPNIEAASEIIRVINNSPKWIPAIRSGKSFSTIIEIPINFKTNKILVSDKINHPPNSISNQENTTEDLNIYNSQGIEVRPEFPGGIKKFYEFIGKNFQTPNQAAGQSGKIFTQFVIEKDGTLSDIKIIRDIGYGTAQEAIRVLQLCPKWSPAEQNGKKVRCIFSLPINISLSK
jgi:Gram-negative bacterial TonB protein C-terminal